MTSWVSLLQGLQGGIAGSAEPGSNGFLSCFFTSSVQLRRFVFVPPFASYLWLSTAALIYKPSQTSFFLQSLCLSLSLSLTNSLSLSSSPLLLSLSLFLPPSLLSIRSSPFVASFATFRLHSFLIYFLPSFLPSFLPLFVRSFARSFPKALSNPTS